MNQIKSGALLSYVNLGLNVLIGLIYTPWIIKSIGISDYGLYTLAMSIIGFLAFDFGLGNATTKFICEYLAQRQQKKVDCLIGIVLKLYLAIDIIILIGFIVMYNLLPEIYEGLTVNELTTFRIVFVIAAVYCTISFPFIPLTGILTGYEKFIQLKLCDLFQRIFIVTTMTICLIHGYGLYALVWVNSIGGILSIIAKLIIVKKNTPLKVDISFWDYFEIRRIFSFVVWVTVIALAQRMIFNIAPSILGIFSDSSEIAILGVAITIESYTYLFANALSGMFLPKVSKMVADKNINAVESLMVKIGRLQIYVCAFILIWFIVFGRQFIHLWIGDTYDKVYLCAILFIIPIFFQLPQEIGITYIVATNKVKLQSYVYISMAVLNIILAVPLSKHFGVVGISIAIFISYIVRTIGIDIVLEKSLKLHVGRFFCQSYCRLLPFLISSIIFIYFICLIPAEGWWGLILKSVFSIGIYCICAFFLGANEYEKSLLTLYKRK